MRTPLILLMVVILAGAAVGGWVAANQLMEGDGGGGTATPTPTPTRIGTLTPTPTVGPPLEGARLVYKEFGSEADVFWLAAAADPQRWVQFAQAEHAAGSGIRASLSPDGKLVAYTLLPVGATDGLTQAEVWVAGLEGGEGRRLTQGVDLASTPVWSPDGTSIVVRRNGPGREIGRAASLVALDVSDASETVVLAEEDVLELFPVGYSPAGVLYVARITIGGTDFGKILPDGSVSYPVHASDQTARDWHLSSDGSRIAFLAGQRTDGRIALRAFVTELVAGAVPKPLSDFASALDVGDHFNPIWHPDGELVAVGRTPTDGASPVTLVSPAGGPPASVTPGPERGFDVPAGFSPDGDYLAVRWFEGKSALEPGREHLMLIKVGGGRAEVGDKGNLEFIGWLPSGAQ